MQLQDTCHATIGHFTVIRTAILRHSILHAQFQDKTVLDKRRQLDEELHEMPAEAIIAPSQLPKRSKYAPGRIKGLIQAYELRDLAHEAAMEFKKSVPKDNEERASSARDIAALIRAWSEADDHVRIHRNKPLPGSLRPVAKPKKVAKARLEPVAIEPVAGNFEPSHMHIAPQEPSPIPPPNTTSEPVL